MNLYTIEKVRELEAEIGEARRQFGTDVPKPRRKPLFGPLAAGAGRTLRRLGEGLETWGAPARDCEQARQDLA